MNIFRDFVVRLLDLVPNRYHPLVWMQGNVSVGEETYIGGFTEVYGKGSTVTIGAHCDIASFVVINVADSHLKTIEKEDSVNRRPIKLGDHVFVGTMTAILGGVSIGHHSVIGAGVILRGPRAIPPYSLVYRDDESGALIIKSGYYRQK